MNFLLSNLEVAISEHHLVVGEKLLDETKVEQLFEGEKNLWITKVDGFEVEIQISPLRVRATSCECDIHLKEKSCGHVAAGLLALRRLLSERKPEKKTRKKKKTVYHKLTTAAILEKVKPEELKAFISKFAKQNRSFSLALNTRFASSVPVTDNHEKYRQIFSNLLQSIRKKDSRVSVNGVKLFLKTCTELTGQADDAVALKHFAEAWAILRSIVEAMPIIIRNIEGDESELRDLADQTFNRLDRLLGKTIAPELRTEIWESYLSETPKVTYRVADLAIYFLKRLPHLANDGAKKKKLIEQLDENWKYRALLSEQHLSELMACKIKVLENPAMADNAERFQQELLAGFKEFTMALKAAMSVEAYAFAKSLLEKGFAHFTIPALQGQLEQMALQLALKKGKKSEIVALSEKLLKATGDVSYLQHCKANYAGKWPVKLAKIIKDIKALPIKKSQKILPLLYAEESMTDDLQDYLLNQGSLDLVREFDHYFLPDKKAELVILYRALLDEYLSQHFGAQPSRLILDLFAHIRKVGGDEVVTQLADFIRKKYPRRMELALELMSI